MSRPRLVLNKHYLINRLQRKKMLIQTQKKRKTYVGIRENVVAEQKPSRNHWVINDVAGYLQKFIVEVSDCHAYWVKIEFGRLTIN